MSILALLLLAQANLGGTGDRYRVDQSLAMPARAPDWRDEFDGSRVDPAKWSFDTTFNRAGWHNNEKQYYGPRYAAVKDGRLVITAQTDPKLRREPDWGGQAYGSARLRTKGLVSWTYGYFEVRAKLPCGKGMWPGIWMLPENGAKWPDGGEIDIMEQVSSLPNMIHATLHSRDYNHVKKTQRGSVLRVPTSCSAFHNYQLHWTPQAITIGVDGRAYFQARNERPGDAGAWPFDTPFHLLLNLAVGGDWPGAVDPAALPQTMEVDWVRVWQEPGPRTAG